MERVERVKTLRGRGISFANAASKRDLKYKCRLMISYERVFDNQFFHTIRCFFIYLTFDKLLNQHSIVSSNFLSYSLPCFVIVILQRIETIVEMLDCRQVSSH